MDLLNLGCGNRFLNNWVNIDFVSSSEDVIAHDLTRGIPFGDNCFDLVYHSHLLEHFDRPTANFFLGECFRVLKPGGIIRVVVPDLEQLAQSYLAELAAAQNGIPGASDRYQWTVIELLDQLVRDRSGGEMAKLWAQKEIPAMDFIQTRVGNEFLSFREQLDRAVGRADSDKSFSFKQRLKKRVKSFRDFLVKILMDDPEVLEKMRLGDFRKKGEVHKWMYDAYALGCLLLETGFSAPAKVDAFSSSHPNWGEYTALDVEDGYVRKPDSLFMEAVK